MNIIVSGWPGAGQTSLSILLAYSLGYKLFQGTNTFRLLGKRLNFENTGLDRIEADELLERDFGPIFDRYQEQFAKAHDGVVIESDIAGFFIKHPNVHEVFLTCDFETRAKRLGIDGRGADIETLKAREEAQATYYKEIADVDFYDTEEIFRKYSQVFENSDMKISQELSEIYRILKVKGVFDDARHDELVANAVRLEQAFLEKGKQFFLDTLIERGLVISGEQVIRDIIEMYRTEVSRFPEELQRAIHDI